MSTVVQVLEPASAVTPTTSFAKQSPRGGSVSTAPGLRFNVNDKAYFTFDAVGYTIGNIIVDIDWFSALGNTSGAVKWEAAIACITPGDAIAVGNKTLGTVSSAESDAHTTAYALVRTTIIISSLDNIADRDLVSLQLKRITASTSMSGGATIVKVTVSYSDT